MLITHNGHTVYPKKYAHGFVVLCFVVVMQSFIMNSHEVFIHIHQGCFAGTGAIVRLPQCQWSKPDGYGIISQCITTTKHSKAKTVCIFLGIYCSMLLMTKWSFLKFGFVSILILFHLSVCNCKLHLPDPKTVTAYRVHIPSYKIILCITTNTGEHVWYSFCNMRWKVLHSDVARKMKTAFYITTSVPWPVYLFGEITCELLCRA